MDHSIVPAEVQPVQIEKGTDHIYNDEKGVDRDAGLATAKEHSLSLRSALKVYPKAITWSILLSMAVIMEGFDTVLVSLSVDLAGETLMIP